MKNIIVIISFFLLAASSFGDVYYILPTKEVILDRDAMAEFTPGGSVGGNPRNDNKNFYLTWNDCSINISLVGNKDDDIKIILDKIFHLIPESELENINKAIGSKEVVMIEVSRIEYPTILQSARQMILCDKLNRLAGGYIMSCYGLYRSDGSLICGIPDAPKNLFLGQLNR